MRIALLVAGLVYLLSLVNPAPVAKSGAAVDPNGRHPIHRHFVLACPAGSSMDPNGGCIPG